MTTDISTVGFLEPRTSSTSSKLLRLTTPWISHKQSPIVPPENIFNLLLRLFVHVLLIKSDERFGNWLTNGVDLRGVTSTLDADAHVNTGEAVAAEEEDRLKRLVPENFWLDELDRNPINFYQPTATLAVGDGHRRLLTTETLHGFSRRRHGCVQTRRDFFSTEARNKVEKGLGFQVIKYRTHIVCKITGISLFGPQLNG